MLTDHDIPFRVPGTFRKLTAAAGLLTLMVCSACGGSGGSASENSGAGTVSAESSCGISGFQSAMLQAIQAARAQARNCGTSGSFAATGSVTWHSALGSSASAHSSDMAGRNTLSHTGSNGSTSGSRVTAAGYAWSAVAENVAWNYTSVDAVMAAWLASDGHCANLMNPNIRHVGAACVAATNGSFYWTLDLAAPL